MEKTVINGLTFTKWHRGFGYNVTDEDDIELCVINKTSYLFNNVDITHSELDTILEFKNKIVW